MTNPSILQQCVDLLSHQHEARFWQVLEELLLSERISKAQELLQMRVHFAITKKHYPSQLGQTLLTLLRSLPPHIRRLDHLFPLLPMRVCIKVSSFAGDMDMEDIQQLIHANAGESLQSCTVTGNESVTSCPKAKSSIQETLQWVLQSISIESLTRTISIPITVWFIHNN